MRISDWSSDVCSSDLEHVGPDFQIGALDVEALAAAGLEQSHRDQVDRQTQRRDHQHAGGGHRWRLAEAADRLPRSEEHTSELQSLMRISYAVFCLKQKTELTVICLKPIQIL